MSSESPAHTSSSTDVLRVILGFLDVPSLLCSGAVSRRWLRAASACPWEALYVAATRGRAGTHLYVQNEKVCNARHEPSPTRRMLTAPCLHRFEPASPVQECRHTDL